MNIEVDTLVVACRKDVALLRLMLESFRLFSRLSGELIIVCDESDLPEISKICLPNKCKLIPKSYFGENIDDGFRSQLFIKLNADLVCRNRFIWIVDCDYLLISDISSDRFFVNGNPTWIYRNWDNEPSLRWLVPTQEILGFAPEFQFMDRAQYVFDQEILVSLRSQIDLNKIFLTNDPPSEFMIYGAFAYKYFYEKYNWTSYGENEGSLSYEITQRPPSYHIINNNIDISDVKNSLYCVFWSYWNLSEIKMLEFLYKACTRRGIDLSSLSFNHFDYAIHVRNKFIERSLEISQSTESNLAIKDGIIERLSAEISLINQDRKAKDDLIDRLIKKIEEIEDDRKSKQDLIERLIKD